MGLLNYEKNTRYELESLIEPLSPLASQTEKTFYQIGSFILALLATIIYYYTHNHTEAKP
ncbi:MAG: hypothetical protein UT59_C0037G0003 [candidate division CPR2 bacterium GW2011_GWD1_39_7]|nr:MAG: hypothetical protein UT59_C0037G0003 [candidate division CPR2 bacterium GW2011_GWD1_39_7]